MSTSVGSADLVPLTMRQAVGLVKKNFPWYSYVMKKDKSTPRPRRALPTPKDATPLKKTKGKTGRKPGRPRVAGESTFVRLDAPTLKRVAARQRTLQEQNRIGNVSQSDTLRSLIVDGLDKAEGTLGKLAEEMRMHIEKGAPFRRGAEYVDALEHAFKHGDARQTMAAALALASYAVRVHDEYERKSK